MRRWFSSHLLTVAFALFNLTVYLTNGGPPSP